MSEVEEVHSLAVAVRAFLQPHWQIWHAAWGPPFPAIASQWTCIRTAAFLVFALRKAGMAAEMCSGRMIGGLENEHGYGFRIDGRWESHAWVRSRQHLIDITADQFGERPILVTKLCDHRYRAGTTADTTLALSEKVLSSLKELESLWLSRSDLHDQSSPPRAPAASV